MSDFVFGVNLPWFDGQYGHDIGRNPQPKSDWEIWYHPETVSHYFQDIKDIGFHAVRVWLMEDAEGWAINDDGIITSLTDTFIRNLEDLVQRAQDTKLSLYFCLTNTWTKVEIPSPVKDERQRDAYLENAVTPIANLLRGNTNIFAIDIFNEIESEVLNMDNPHRVSVEEAKTFVRSNVQAIKAEDSNRLVSAGSGWRGADSIREGHYNNLGLDFFDIHIYDDNGTLPSVSELDVDVPVYVGECGQFQKVQDDQLQQASIMGFLRNATTKGYAGCFLWAYGPEQYLEITVNGRHRPVIAGVRDFIKDHRRRVHMV